MEKLSKVEDPALTAVSALAEKVFSVLGVRDFGRIDVKMDAHGVPHFIRDKSGSGHDARDELFSASL